MTKKDDREKVKVFSLRLPEELWKRVSIIAFRQGVTKTHVIMNEINKYVEKNKKFLDNE